MEEEEVYTFPLEGASRPEDRGCRETAFFKASNYQERKTSCPYQPYLKGLFLAGFFAAGGSCRLADFSACTRRTRQVERTASPTGSPIRWS